jgi:ferredoxin-NADP reductase
MNKSSRYERRAQVMGVERLTTTGTIRVSFRVVDDRPFGFAPGNFVGIDCDLPKLGYRRSPYCIFSPPDERRTFQNLVRVVPEGPVSNFLAALKEGDVISFRGPTGRSMTPKEGGTDLILLATGVGLGPLNSLVRFLLARGFGRTIRLYWGLRLAEDICLLDELDELAGRHPNFTYRLSLSQPPAGWRGLRGRLTESVPPLLETLGGKHFYLCSNGAMIAEMSRALSDLGVPKSLIYEEYFFNFKYRPREETVARIRGRFVARDLASPLAGLDAMLSRSRV